MNTFRTDVSVSKSGTNITHQTPILTIGSCFADAIGQQLCKFKFPTLVNPFGVVYNPLSLHKLLSMAVGNTSPTEYSYLENQGLHLNFDFHSQLSARNLSELESRLTMTIGRAHEFLKTCRWILVTYGTAWVYERIDNGEIVANCHKVPARNFSRRLLDEAEITGSFAKVYTVLQEFNPGIRIILTVSPVRHLRDTLELNSVSKAVVRTACHSIVTRYPGTEYFPAYEIMLDDLRDYRFYRSDMLHPNSDAEQYIWDKFAKAYFDDATLSFMKEWEDIIAAVNHRPFHPGSERHQKFLRETLKKLERFKGRVNTDDETSCLEKQLL